MFPLGLIPFAQICNPVCDIVAIAGHLQMSRLVVVFAFRGDGGKSSDLEPVKDLPFGVSRASQRRSFLLKKVKVEEVLGNI